MEGNSHKQIALPPVGEMSIDLQMHGQCAMKMRLSGIRAALVLPNNWEPLFVYDTRGYWYFQVQDTEAICNVTGEPYPWTGRKWLLSEHMTEGEIVQTVFKAVLTAIEHEAREAFLYKGQAIFDPHYDIEKLTKLRSQADALSTRSDQQAHSDFLNAN
ncbi:hypothetical protein [Roseibium sediminis]|uniref:hypothetical protein n=1 Tax=Roseibium sediminis TaxID=1775174 RepID=UPI00123E0039|nr:hypothetical protein [Roseibium sediminis]